MAMKCADRCKTRPKLDTLATLQKPSVAAADRNNHNEPDPEAWDDVRSVRVHVRNRRASEIVTVDQVEAVRFVAIECWGDALLSNLPAYYRFVYRDRFNVEHIANVTGVRPDGTWVVIDAEEKV